MSAATERFDPKDVVVVKELRDPSALASIVRVGNEERRGRDFSLSQKSELRIYAVGEASGNDMADYAWIEDVTSGKFVWEMRYRMTEHAGGARKNRLFDRPTARPSRSS